LRVAYWVKTSEYLVASKNNRSHLANWL